MPILDQTLNLVVLRPADHQPDPVFRIARLADARRLSALAPAMVSASCSSTRGTNIRVRRRSLAGIRHTRQRRPRPPASDRRRSDDIGRRAQFLRHRLTVGAAACATITPAQVEPVKDTAISLGMRRNRD
ncbi:MAG: hypothetical protein R3D84_03565 [Paracoccaceae bacterium]